MPNLDPETLDKVRHLSARDMAYILEQILSGTDAAGVKLLGKKSDGTFENIKSDDTGRLQVYDPKVYSLQGLIYWCHVTTVIDATHFASADLIGQGNGKFAGGTPFRVFVFWDADGAAALPQGEMQPIAAFTSASGTVQHTAFSGPLALNDELFLVNPIIASLFGLPTAMNSVAANWQTAEQNLVTIGANGTSYKMQLLVIGIQNLVGNISIRLYHRVNGVERRIYPIPAGTTFNVAADAPAIPIINAQFTITEALRVTVQSDNVLDNMAAVTYEYKLEGI